MAGDLPKREMIEARTLLVMQTMTRIELHGRSPGSPAMLIIGSQPLIDTRSAFALLAQCNANSICIRRHSIDPATRDFQVHAPANDCKDRGLSGWHRHKQCYQ